MVQQFEEKKQTSHTWNEKVMLTLSMILHKAS